MTPPPARSCEARGCDWISPEWCTTYQAQREEMSLHFDMVHRFQETKVNSSILNSSTLSPRNCEVINCEYKTPEWCQTREEQRSEMTLHVEMNHRGKEEKSEEKGSNKMMAKMERPTVLDPLSETIHSKMGDV